jgi:hypothetical protein
VGFDSVLAQPLYELRFVQLRVPNLVTSMGISHRSIESLHASSSSSKNLSQIVPHVPSKSALFPTSEDFSHALTSSHLFSISAAADLVHYTAPAHHAAPHVSTLGHQGSTSHPKWKPSSNVQAVCQLQDKNKVLSFSRPSVDFFQQYPLINEAMSLNPLLYAYPQLNPNNSVTSRPEYTRSLHSPVPKSNLVGDGLFHQFLSSWAQSGNTLSFSGPPHHFYLTHTHPSLTLSPSSPVFPLAKSTLPRTHSPSTKLTLPPNLLSQVSLRFPLVRQMTSHPTFPTHTHAKILHQERANSTLLVPPGLNHIL